MSLPLTDMGRKSGEDTVGVIIVIVIMIMTIIIMGRKSSEVDGKLAFLE